MKLKKVGYGVTMFIVVAAVIGVILVLSLMMGNVEPAEPSITYTTKEFCTQRDGQAIRGYIFLPDDGRKGRREVFIMSHGFSEVAVTSSRTSKALAEMGVAAVSFDFCGSAPKSQSDGNMMELSVATEMADLNAVIDAISHETWCDTTNIYLCGMSMGGVVASEVAAHRSDIAGLILHFPALDRDEQTRACYKSKSDIPDIMDMFGVKLGRKFWEWFYDAHIMDEISTYDGPVLIIHGTEDNMVHYRHSIRADSLYAHSSLFLIEGAGHGFGNKDDFLSAVKTTYHFIQKCLNRPQNKQ